VSRCRAMFRKEQTVERRSGSMSITVMADKTFWVVKPTRKDTHATSEECPVRPGINAQTPASMPRAEDDEATRANSPEFHDRPGSGKHTADRQRVF
jgi:hypothetical protein